MAAQWYFTNNGQQMGPVTAADLKSMAANGQIQPTDLVWKEGLANWIPANQTKGLFPANAPSGITSQPAQTTAPVQSVPQSETQSHQWTEPAAGGAAGTAGAATQTAEPRRQSYDEPERPRRRRRKRRPQKSSGGGGIWLMLGGLAVVFVLCAGGIGLGVWWFNTPSPMEGSYSWSLNSNKKRVYNLYLRKGHRVELRVNSSRASDVDLIVFDGSREIAQDKRESSNCRIDLVPTSTQYYRVVVWNRVLMPDPGRNGYNNGTLSFRHIPLSGGGAPPPIVKGGGPIVPPGKGKGGIIDPPPNPPVNPPVIGGGRTILSSSGVIVRNSKRTHNVTLQANTLYTIDVTSNIIDPMLAVYNPNGQLVAEDDDSGGGVRGLDSRVNYRAPRTGLYRLEVRSFDRNRSGPYRITVRQ